MRLLTELHCLPSVQAFVIYSESDEIIFEAHENYQKRSFRNRFYLNSAQGRIAISIPLSKGKNEAMPITEVKISYEENWVRSTLRLIQTNYQSSPYFDFYFDDLADIFKAHFVNLFELNLALFDWMNISSHLKLKYGLSTSFETNLTNSKLLDKRNFLTPINIANAPTISYPQVFEDKVGFIESLSLLDMLFCCGPETSTRIRNPNAY